MQQSACWELYTIHAVVFYNAQNNTYNGQSNRNVVLFALHFKTLRFKFLYWLTDWLTKPDWLVQTLQNPSRCFFNGIVHITIICPKNVLFYWLFRTACFDLSRSSSSLHINVMRFLVSVYHTYMIIVDDVCILNCVACSVGVFLGLWFVCSFVWVLR